MVDVLCFRQLTAMPHWAAGVSLVFGSVDKRQKKTLRLAASFTEPGKLCD